MNNAEMNILYTFLYGHVNIYIHTIYIFIHTIHTHTHTHAHIRTYQGVELRHMVTEYVTF